MEVKEYKEEVYRTIFGVGKNTFEAMITEVENEYNNIHKKGAEKMAQILLKTIINLSILKCLIQKNF